MADERPRCPVMLHFGEEDKSIPLDKVEIVRAKHPGLPLFTYPGAGHGFSCDARGSYHAESAAKARERSLAFLREHLG
jgi:carboxymethylenebutenolidase